MEQVLIAPPSLIADAALISVDESIEEHRMMMMSRSGPIPDGEVMLIYKEVDPALPMAIMQMAQDEAKHRRQLETMRLQGELEEAKGNRDFRHRGQLFGLVIAVIFGVIALVAALYGHPWFGSVIGGGVLFSLVVVFVTGKVVRPQPQQARNGAPSETSAP
jgi:uncharacterized membrane protein